MKWLPLLWTALRRRPLRSVLTLLSIIVAFVLVGLVTGIDASIHQTLDKARVDRIVINGRFSAWLPLADADQIAKLSGVKSVAASGYLVGFYQDPKNFIGINMTDERILAVQPELNVAPEMFARLKAVQDGALVSKVIADKYGWSVGKAFPLQSERKKKDGTNLWTFNVVGILPDNASSPDGFILGNAVYLDQGRGDGLAANASNLQILINDPDQTGPTSDAVEHLFANSEIPVIAVPERNLYENAFKSVFDMEFFTYALSAAALFMIVFLTGTVLAQSVRERTPEFAVMKTLGFSDNGIFTLILAEAAIPTLIGACLGLFLATWIPTLASFTLPNAPEPKITAGVIVFSLTCALVVAVMGGLPAAWRMKRLSIAQALGGR